MTNLKFDEVVESDEDILGAFEVAENKEASKPEVIELEDMPSFDEVDNNVVASSSAVVENKEQVNMSNNETVTISANQFSDLLNMVKELTEEVAGLKAGKAAPKAKKEKAASVAKPKRTREQYMVEMKEKSKVKAAERRAKCISESGKSPAEVQAAFNMAHAYAKLDQNQYKARYDEKLIELIGVKKFAV